MDKAVAGYKVSVWTDPDVTDDQSAAGRFWVTVEPGATRVVVSIRPLDRAGSARSAVAEPVNGDHQRNFTALLMDHEGPFGVHVAIDGAPGKAEVDASTDATYDLRPRPILTVLFVLPFVLAGFVWESCLSSVECTRRGGRDGQSRDCREPEQDSSQPGEDREESETHPRKSEAHSRKAQEVIRYATSSNTVNGRLCGTRLLSR